MPRITDPAEELGPTIDELVEIARAAGEPNASRRTVRHWVSRGLVPPPKRAGRGWRYPLRAIGQVDAVTKWRRRGATLDETRFAVFIETGGGSAQDALAFTRAFLEAWEQSVSTGAAEARSNPAMLEERRRRRPGCGAGRRYRTASAASRSTREFSRSRS